MLKSKQPIDTFMSIINNDKDLQFHSELIGEEMVISIIQKRITSENFDELGLTRKETGNKLFDWTDSIEIIFNAAGFILDAFSIFDWIKEKSNNKKVKIEDFKEEYFKLNTNSTIDKEIVFNYILENKKSDIQC